MSVLIKFIFAAALSLLALSLSASERIFPVTNRISFDVTGACVPHTSSFFDGNNRESKSVDMAVQANVKYSFSFPCDSKLWAHYPGAYQGIGFGVNSFMAGSLTGTPVGLYVFQGAPLVRLSSRLSLGYEWNFGASFGWKKYDSETDEMNIIGSRANAYMNLAVLLNYRFAPDWQFGIGLTGSHFSNGNTSQPNSGVNTLGLRMGLTYTIGGEPFADMGSLVVFSPHFSYDLLLYGAWRSKVVHIDGQPVALDGKFGVAGVNFAPMYDFHRLFRAGLSFDFKYDESAGIMRYHVETSDSKHPLFYRPPLYRSICAGLSAKAEFVMPVFSVAVGFGRNIVAPEGDRGFYQTLALKTYILDNLFLNVGYQLQDFKTPSNLMLGVGYRFHSSR